MNYRARTPWQAKVKIKLKPRGTSGDVRGLVTVRAWEGLV
jgi:hypothetical protein